MPSRTSRRHKNSRRQRSTLLFLRDILIIFLAAIIISVGIKAFLVRSFYIPSESMNDTLQVDDRIIVSLLTPTVFAIDRGEVVVFEDPGGWLPELAERLPGGVAARLPRLEVTQQQIFHFPFPAPPQRATDWPVFLQQTELMLYSLPGDLVIVKHSKGPTLKSWDGFGDWNASFANYRSGSALG